MAGESVICKVEQLLRQTNLTFLQKPLLIGGMAMEYYGLRKSGADIDLVIDEQDYQALAAAYPENRKDIYGDLGVVIQEFEMWRSIALLDYTFLKQGAVNAGNLLVVSLDRLLLMRVCAMDVEKYRKDLELIKQYYYAAFRNADYLREAETHVTAYGRNDGVVFGGNYANDGI